MTPLESIQTEYAIATSHLQGPLTRIQAIEALKVRLFLLEASLIEEWRYERGATWQEVATATGAGSKQAAQQRWGGYMTRELP
jgi:hypothetical protein